MLTKQSIDSLVSRARAAKGSQLELIDEREPGLRIRAGERSANWILNARLKNGKRSRIKLGPWPTMTIADARAHARERKREIAEGIDPNAARREALEIIARTVAQRVTTRQAIERYDLQHLYQLRRGDATRRALEGPRGLLSAFLDRDIGAITRADVSGAVARHATTAPIAANRSLAYAKAFFNWCVDESIIEESPAARVRKPSRENERDRYHSVSELREIWEAASTLGYPFGPLVRLLIALPMRRDEIAAMPISELNLSDVNAASDGIWTLPAARTKRANALRVPLSQLAKSIILQARDDPSRPTESPFLFSMTSDTPVSGFAKAKRRLDGVIHAGRIAKNPIAAAMPHWTFHDLRTTFNTLACDELGIDEAVADRILNHVASATTSKVKRIYNRSELFGPRRHALSLWGQFLEKHCRAAEHCSVGSPIESALAKKAKMEQLELLI
jgi:integrase